MKKIEVYGGGLIITDVDSGDIEGIFQVSETWFDEEALRDKQIIRFFDVAVKNTTKVIEPEMLVGEAVDKNGEIFTEESFRNFALTNLGDIGTGTFSYTDGGLDVVLQDSTSPLLIVPFSKTVAETTLTAQLAKEDRVINVTDSTGFVVDHLVTIYSVLDNRVYFGRTVSIDLNEVTLDTPLDFEFPVGSFVSSGIWNMNVDGSVTPQIFGVRNPSNQDVPLKVDITRVIFKMLTATSVDLSKFGDIVGGLTFGIVLRKTDGEYRNIFNAKTNGELKSIMYDVFIQLASGNQQDGLAGRLTFSGQEKMGSVVRLAANEDLQIIIQDDLTQLSQMTWIAEGSYVVE